MSVREIIKRNPTAMVIAVAMHLALILLMLFGTDWWETPTQPKLNVQVVQARLIDEKVVAAEVEKLKQSDAKREKEKEAARTKEEKALAQLKKQQADEKKRLADLKKKRRAEDKKRKSAETKRIAEEKKRKAAEVKRKAEEKKLQQTASKRKAEEKRQKAADAKRLAEEKKRRTAEAKKKAAEKKRKAAEAKIKAAEKKRKAAEAKKKAAEKKRKAAEAKKRAAEAKKKAAEKKRREAEAAAQKKLEDELIASMEAERNAREIDRFVARISQKVVSNWLRPAGISDGLVCSLRVRIAPGGTVLAVSVAKSSGVGAFDRSATAAVYKAEPLPVPTDKLFESFRDIIFEFDPSDKL